MGQRTCSAPDCNRPRRHRDWCGMHYQRWMKHGTITLPLKATTEERFFVKVAADGDCWRWVGAIGSHGYGNFYAEGKYLRAHTWAYTFFRADVPEGLQLDHLCRNRWCVNPWHLEPVTCSVNLLRIPREVREASRPTHCKAGHLLDEVNTYIQRKTGYRYCRTCQRR